MSCHRVIRNNATASEADIPRFRTYDVRTYYTLALADNIVVNGFLILNFRQTGSG